MPDYVSLPYDPAAQSYLSWLFDKEVGQQDLYTQYREYYDGDHDTQLTDRQKKFLELKDGQEFNVNYCPIVVDTLAERLVVTGFDAGEQGEQMWEWWQANRMDAEAGITHTAAVRDGDTFVLLDWDDEEKRPTFTFELACANNEGVKVVYSKENRKQIEFASKRWRIDQGKDAGKLRRLNLYFPDHIEKYQSKSDQYEGNWLPFLEEGEEAQEGELGQCGWHWWTDNRQKSGKPLGVPVVHFKNKDQGYERGQSELKDVLPIQNALNKAVIDLIGTADTAGFPIFVGLGDPGWGDLDVGPGIVLSTGKSPQEADLKKLSAEDMKPLISLKDSFAIEIARVTRTPLSYFQVSGQMPAEGAEKQREAGLIARVTNRQVTFGNAWEDMMKIARRLHNAFGQGKLDEKQSISTLWKDAQTRNEKEHLETLKLKAELGIPQEQIWREMGYDDTQIAQFRRDALRNQALAIRETVKAGQNGNAQTQPEESPNGGQPEPTPTE